MKSIAILYDVQLEVPDSTPERTVEAIKSYLGDKHNLFFPEYPEGHHPSFYKEKT